MKTRRKAGGFTLVEIMIVVAIIGLLSAIALPNFVKSREISHRKVCISNLRQLETAVQSWAVEMRKNNDDPVDSNALFGNTNFIKNQVYCPAGGTYVYTVVGAPDHVYCTLRSTDGHSLGN